MRRSTTPTRRALLALAAGAVLLAPAAAGACVQLGAYEDDPAGRPPPPGARWLSTYLTAGKALDPALVSLANRRHLGLVVSWLPDGGRDTPSRRYRLSTVSGGRYDRSLRALARRLRHVRRGAVVRPMPEPNTPWYSWSGAVNGNSARAYVTAFKRVRAALRAGGGQKVRVLWTPYARSIPDTAENAIAAYFPGKAAVDLVGADAYDFGTVGALQAATPAELFVDAYTQIAGLAAKPFWIGETGTVARGAARRAWITAVGALEATLPRLAAVVWFDAKDPTGDFRLLDGAARTALRGLAKGGCS